MTYLSKLIDVASPLDVTNAEIARGGWWLVRVLSETSKA